MTRRKSAKRSSVRRAAAPAAGIDPLAIAVRFQSVIGLVVVAIGGVVFSPRRHGLILFLAPDNIANIVRAVSETGIIARRHDLRHHHRRHRSFRRRAAQPVERADRDAS